MSPFFVKKFKKENHCAHCTTYSAQEGRSMCLKHLKIAKLAFLVWSSLRARARLCIACPKKVATGNNCRCKEHRRANKEKCIEWMRKKVAENPHFHRDRGRSVTARWLAEGKCRCSGHPPLVDGLTVCEGCRLRHKVDAGTASKAELRQYREVMRAKRTAKEEARAGRVAEARRDMVELGYAPARASSHSKDGWSIKGRIAA